MSDPALDLEEVSGKRERSKAVNRQAILDAARRVFAQLGYEATTVRDIIRGTSLASGTFYNYFRSKEEVFDALHDDGVRRFRPVLTAALENARTFEQLVRGAVTAYFRFLADERVETGPLGGLEAVHAHVDTPEMRAVFEEVRVHIAAIVGQGGAPMFDVEYFTAAAIGAAREVGARMCARPAVEIEPAVEFCVRMLLAGAAAGQQEGAR